MKTIAEHTTVPAGSRDLAWIEEALQIAVAVEHSTLPLYLAAIYSLPVQSYTAYNLIRSVAMEEMAHMATASNLLAAIGGRPRIAGLDPGFPSHGLPGGAEPDVDARLAQLSKRQLGNFMRIETPTFLLPAQYASEGYPTIGALYGAIARAFRDNADAVRDAVPAANQVGDSIGIATIGRGGDPLDEIEHAIEQIVEQGEGSPSRTLRADPDSEGEESHYCRFAELYYGRRFEPLEGVELTRETEPQFFSGWRIPMPEVANTLAAPSDGYARVIAEDPEGAAAETSLAAFDSVYTEVMAQLDAAWNGPADGAWSALGASVRAMGALRVPATFEIATKQIPPAVVGRLDELYPDEHPALAAYTDLDAPVFYGPRFRNLAASGK
jgi:Ferritin-like